MEPDDVQLLTAYQRDGDQSAFVQLVDRHGGWIFAAARRRLGDDHLAADATQAVFVVLAEKAGQLVESQRGSLSAWLFHVVHFSCARLRRAQLRQTELEKSLAATRTNDDRENTAADGPLLVLLEDSIAQLPAIEREMIVGRFYQRKSFAEIGHSISVSADAARKRLTRALSQIKEMMVRNGVDAIPDMYLMNLRGPAKDQNSKTTVNSKQINAKVKEQVAMIMIEQSKLSQGGFQMISAEFLVADVEANLEFFEKLGFPRRFVDSPDEKGRIPRASLTAGHLGKIWIRRADDTDIHPSPSINVFFWIDGGPEGLIAHRSKIANMGVPVSPIIDEHRLPNFNVITPDGYSIAFFTQYVAPSQPPVVLVT